jgi:hypothetical protein
MHMPARDDSLETAAPPSHPASPSGAVGFEVFLVPLRDDRHELYCEIADAAVTETSEPPRGLFSGLMRRFREMLAMAEREGEHGHAHSDRGLLRRIRDRVLRLVAERVAEQRLLWHLRSQVRATVVYPEDLTSERAMAAVKTTLRADADRHLRWLIVDFVLFAISGLLVLIPGPNLVAYYFAFRVVGHFLSMRGAKQGLDRVEWTMRPSRELAELRQATRLTGPERDARVREIASRLHLTRLVRFFERLAVRTA